MELFSFPVALRAEGIKMQLVLFEAATCGGGGRGPTLFGRDDAFGKVIYIRPDCI